MALRRASIVTLGSVAFALAACSGEASPIDASVDAPVSDRGVVTDSGIDTALDAVESDTSDAIALDASDDVQTRSDGSDTLRDASTDRGDVPAVTIAFQNGVEPTSSYLGTTDTYLAESAATTNYATSTTLWADGDVPAGMQNTKVTLVRWDVRAVPTGSTVASASITIALSGATNDATSDRYSIYAMLRDWSETEANWNVATGGDYWAMAGAAELGRDHGVREIGGIAPLAAGSATIRLNADGVALVQQWVDDPSSNYGVQINSWIADNGLGLASSESTTASLRPKLTIVYMP
jgi:hypothetical protein